MPQQCGHPSYFTESFENEKSSFSTADFAKNIDCGDTSDLLTEVVLTGNYNSCLKTYLGVLVRTVPWCSSNEFSQYMSLNIDLVCTLEPPH